MHVEEFKYLGSARQSNRQCTGGVKKRVQDGWSEWKRVSGLICYRKIGRLTRW